MDRPRLLREWVGLRCRLIRNCAWGSGLSLPAGTIVDVVQTTAKGDGTGLVVRQAFPCPHCGARLERGRVRPFDLQPLDRIAPPKPARSRGWSPR